LFSIDTAVVHISGNKENIGEVLKTSNNIFNVFGFREEEVVG